jgi:hypothetical protein
MRYQKDNPIFDPAYLGKNGRYPARHVDIFWNRADDFSVCDVAVILAPLDKRRRDPDAWARYKIWHKKWAASLGNSCDGWMEPEGTSPAEAFGVLLSCGFRDVLEMQTALREFSMIEECDWAREMLKGFPVEEDAPDWL